MTCPYCRGGVQQDVLKELSRPFSLLDILLVPLMLIAWGGQSLFEYLHVQRLLELHLTTWVDIFATHLPIYIPLLCIVQP
jgi:fatty-acid desaturase